MQESNNLEEQLRLRLAEVARRYPQAEIARRTGTTPSNVSRYLRGIRVPAAFTASLCSEFGVNPAWLILGRGAAWAADVEPGQAEMSDGLLDLVNAMTRIGRLRLGAIAGKTEAKSLSELNDAINAFERQREQLAAESRAVYSRLLDDWQAAIAGSEVDRARHLREAAEQLARVCPDPDLELRRLEVVAEHLFLVGRYADGLLARKRFFLSTFASTGEVNEHTLGAVVQLVIALDGTGRFAESLRFVEAALALAPPGAEAWPGYRVARALKGWLTAETGHPAQGLALLSRELSANPPAGLADNIRHSMNWILYLTGASDLATCVAFAQGRIKVLRGVLLLSTWCLDAVLVRGVLKQFRASRRGGTYDEEHVAQIHLAALEGNKTEALRELRNAEATTAKAVLREPPLHFSMLVLRTQVLRLVGRTADARAAFAQANKSLQALPPGVMAEMNWTRIHWRNGASLADPATAHGRRVIADASAFATWARAQGFQAHDG